MNNVQLWTTSEDHPLYVGQAKISTSSLNYGCYRRVTYSIDYREVCEGSFGLLDLPCYNGESLILYVSGSTLNPRYGFIPSLTLNTVELFYTGIRNFFDDEGRYSAWHGEFHDIASLQDILNDHLSYLRESQRINSRDALRIRDPYSSRYTARVDYDYHI